MHRTFIKQNSDQFESFPSPTGLPSEGREPRMCKIKHGVQKENTRMSIYIYITSSTFPFCIFYSVYIEILVNYVVY